MGSREGFYDSNNGIYVGWQCLYMLCYTLLHSNDIIYYLPNVCDHVTAFQGLIYAIET